LGLVKSKLIKNLANQYPNFYSKDLTKIINIFIEEIKTALKNGERVELRNFATFSIRKRKSRKSRNPKSGEELLIPEKNSIYFKMTKDLFNKINDN
jgi:Bacterial nucleoid DNA-binding protein